MTDLPDGGRPTTAFVLAAGFGTRMRPLTDDRPKPMVMLGGRPLIDHVLDRLAAAGVARAVVNVHYKADVLLAHLAHRRAPEIVISDERAQLLDTGGGVVKALPQIGPGSFIVHNSDTVWLERAEMRGASQAQSGRSNLDRLIKAWSPERMDGLLLLARRDSSIGYDGAGDFELQPEGRLIRRRQGMESPYVFAGVSIAHPRLLDEAPSGAFSLNAPWDRAIEAGRLFGIELEGLWMHVGTPEAVTEAGQRIDGHGGG